MIVDDIRKAMALLRDARPYAACTHVVQPRYVADYDRVYEWQQGDVMVPCAMLCGASLVFRPKGLA